MSKRNAINALEVLVLAGIALWIYHGPTVSQILRRFGWSALFLVFFAALITILHHKA